jgi:hypothetical protein
MLYFADQPFHTKYQASNGDTVANLAKRRGFPNPGPLIAYPPNQPLFARKYGPNFLTVSRDFALSNGDSVYLPWREEALRNLVTAFEKLIKDIRKDSDDLINGLMKDKEDLESYLMKLDILAVASGSVIGTFTAAGVYAAELKGIESVLMKPLPLLKGPVGDFLLGRFLTVGGVVAVATDAPSASRKRWDTLRLVVRHTLNVPSPSYWASVIMAFKEGDADIWWSGPDHIVADKARDIAARAKSEIQNFQNGVDAAKRQLALSFYRYTI